MIKSYTEFIGKELENHNLVNHARSWFTPTELKTIYAFGDCPRPPKYAVLSFGGGLFGTISANGTVTGGDLQTYWSYLNLATTPTVKLVLLQSETNDTSDLNSTAENTLDVQTIGACRPESTIVLIRVKNEFLGFATAMQYVLNDGTFTNVSISWGAPEIYFGASKLNTINTVFANAVAQNIFICAATGDNGSNNGVGGTGSYADFPSSSPNVVACGGTNLVSPNRIYDSSTREVAWSYGGGARSVYFTKPSFQSSLSGGYRSIPDVALVADPNTGVVFYVNGSYVVYGGTSVASPLMSAAMGGVPASGFMSKLYTRNRNVFHDILSGSNGAFTASVGYDLCTGLGSINGALLLSSLSDTTTDPSYPTGTTEAAGPIKINISVTSWSTVVRKTLNISGSLFPSGSGNNTLLTWASSNSSVVSLSRSSGGSVVANAIARGTSTVTCSYNNNLSAICQVTVLAEPIKFRNSNISIRRSKTYQLTGNFTVAAWSSSNNKVATVSSNGLVTGITRGQCIISATVDGWIANCRINVS